MGPEIMLEIAASAAILAFAPAIMAGGLLAVWDLFGF